MFENISSKQQHALWNSENIRICIFQFILGEESWQGLWLCFCFYVDAMEWEDNNNW